jgi:putative hemolysin
MFFEILLILALIVANGLFAMSEAAMISARKARLQQRVNEGDARAQIALELGENPGVFLATSQIGITLIGILAGAFGGATIADALAVPLAKIAFLAPYSQAIAFTLVVLVITALSLIVGELVPKQLALNNPESVASAVAGPMRTLSRLVKPLVRLLNATSAGVLKLAGVQPSSEQAVTEEEIKVMIEQGTQAGTFDETERYLVGRVFRLADLRVEAIMTPRVEVTWFDVDDSQETVRHKINQSGRSRFPVCQGSLDNVLGVVRAKDLLARTLAGQPFDLRASLLNPLFVPGTVSALKMLELFKESTFHLALVIDEYGGLQGVLTIADVVEEIIGGELLSAESEQPRAVQRDDGSWLLDGLMAIDEVKEVLGLRELPGENEGDYQTLGGFIMAQFGRIPEAADHLELAGLRFEVVDMDGHRVDKVLVMPAPPAQITPTD